MSLVRRCRISLTDHVQELEVLVRPHGLILETAAGCRLMQGNGGAKIRDSVILRLARSQIGHMPSLGSISEKSSGRDRLHAHSNDVSTLDRSV